MSTPFAPPTPLQISYIDPDGVNWNLSDLDLSNGFCCAAISGIDGFPVSMQTYPLLDGTAIPNIYNPAPGTIGLAILVTRPESSHLENDYYTTLDYIVRAFYTHRSGLPAPGTLIIQRPNGASRQISVYTTSGLDTPEVGLNNTLIYSLSLSTPDPYWYDLTPQQLVFNLNYATGILPLLPITLAGSTVFGSTTINNPATANAYPVWVITGPGTPTMTNNTTGLKWSMNTAIPAGQVVTVDTRRGKQAAVNSTTGNSVWDQLVYSSLRQLWPFVPGNNNITISMAGATAATQVQLSWQNRWIRA